MVTSRPCRAAPSRGRGSTTPRPIRRAAATIEPTAGELFNIIAFVVVVLGGMGNVVGALVGGLIIGVTLNLIVQYVPAITSELQLPFAFAVLIVVLLIKPSGLFGHRQVRRV